MMKRPTKIVALGDAISINKVIYDCVERDLTNVAPCDACKGCDLDGDDVCKSASVACSRFDRWDGKNVKFIRRH